MTCPKPTSNQPAGSLICRLVAFGVLSLVLGPASQAEASCGDYLHHLAQDTASQAPRPDQALPHEQPHSPLPRCSGPSCRQAPVTPIPDAPSSSHSSTEERGCLNASFPLAVTTKSDHCTSDRSAVELRPDRTRLERPPQTV